MAKEQRTNEEKAEAADSLSTENKRLDFNYNWNGKLFGRFFTTLRVSRRYQVGQTYDIYLNGTKIYQATINDIRDIRIGKVNEWVARLDTGYSLKETLTIIKRMYKRVDWKVTFMRVILFERLGDYDKATVDFIATTVKMQKDK